MRENGTRSAFMENQRIGLDNGEGDEHIKVMRVSPLDRFSHGGFIGMSCPGIASEITG